MTTGKSSARAFLRSALAVFLKDWRSELRTRYAVSALLMFVVTTISIILFSLGSEGASPDALSGMLWVVVFFAAMSGLSRTFVMEEERGTTLTLQLLAPPGAVFLGKLLFNLVLVTGVNAVTVILYAAFINGFVIRTMSIFVVAVGLGSIGFAAAATVIAAIIARANTKGTLYPVLSFPIAGNLPEDAQPDPLPPGKYVVIEVHDEGPGISADQLPRIFEPYFTTKRKGSGLGLATAYSIVRNHGGHIVASSVPGRGATFSIYLPASPAATVSVEPGRPEDWRGHGRLLLMDDEILTLRALSTLLQKLGFDVATTTDGQATIDAYVRAIDERRPFDAVIMDLTVPGGMGGREAATRLLALHPPARLIVSSGYSNDPVMSEFEKHGFCAVLAKPYSTGDLVAVLRTILGDQSVAKPVPPAPAS